MHEYSGMLFTFSCSTAGEGVDSYKQALTVKTVEQGDKTRFKLLMGGGRCVEPVQEETGKIVRVLSDCSGPGVWRWSHDALLEWSGGGCLASLSGQDKTVIAPCDRNIDDQIVEVGVTITEGNETKLAPIDMELWKERMDRKRQQEIML